MTHKIMCVLMTWKQKQRCLAEAEFRRVVGRLGVQREVVGHGTIYCKKWTKKISDFLSLPPLPFILVPESRQTLPFSSDFLIALSYIFYSPCVFYSWPYAIYPTSLRLYSYLRLYCLEFHSQGTCSLSFVFLAYSFPLDLFEVIPLSIF